MSAAKRSDVPQETTEEKSIKFALRIIKMYRYLQEEKKEFILSKQVLRSGTSIGANLAEASCAQSKRDFLTKLYIALKECAETKYWLLLLSEAKYLSADQFNSMNKDCETLRLMLSSATKTLNEQLNKTISSPLSASH